MWFWIHYWWVFHFAAWDSIKLFYIIENAFLNAFLSSIFHSSKHCLLWRKFQLTAPPQTKGQSSLCVSITREYWRAGCRTSSWPFMNPFPSTTQQSDGTDPLEDEFSLFFNGDTVYHLRTVATWISFSCSGGTCNPALHLGWAPTAHL